MGDTRYVLPAPESLSMTGEAARRLIGCGSGDAALTYLYILNAGGRFDPEDCARRTGRTVAQIEAAMTVLRRLGLAAQEEEPREKPRRPEELPTYTTEEVRRELEQGETFKTLCGEVEGALGRKLSTQDLITLFGIYDYLRLPPEVILTLVTHCREEHAKRYGPSRLPTLRYIEKVAYTWEREGIFSLETAEAYLKSVTERQEGYTAFAHACGIRERTLSASEKRYVNAWRELGFTPEAAELAYDRTVVQTGKLSWGYMDAILRRWHQAGLHTPEEIEAKDAYRRPEPGKSRPQKADGHEPVTEEDLERLRRLREML